MTNFQFLYHFGFNCSYEKLSRMSVCVKCCIAMQCMSDKGEVVKGERENRCRH